MCQELSHSLGLLWPPGRGCRRWELCSACTEPKWGTWDLEQVLLCPGLVACQNYQPAVDRSCGKELCSR